MKPPTKKAEGAVEYPRGSGIRLRQVKNADGGVSWQIDIPRSLTLTGKRIRIQKKDEEEAKQTAREKWEGARDLGKSFFQLSDLEKRQCVEAIALLKPKRLDLLDVVKIGIKHTQVSDGTKTVRECVDLLYAAKAKKGKSWQHLKGIKQRLGRFAETFGDRPIASLTGGELDRWVNDLDVANTTKVCFGKLVKLLFNWAIKEGKKGQHGFPPPEFSAHNAIEFPDIRKTSVRIFDVTEVGAILKQAPEEMKAALAICFFAGVRSEECLRLLWSDIVLSGDEPHIRVRQEVSKTNEERLIPVQVNLAAWLNRCQDRSGKVWKGTRSRFFHLQEVIARQLGMVWVSNGCRHSYASYRLGQVKHAGQVAEETGHTITILKRHYRQVVQSSEAAAFFNIFPEAAQNIVPLASATA